MNKRIVSSETLLRAIAFFIGLWGALAAAAENFAYTYEGHTYYFESIDGNTCKLVSPEDGSTYSGDIVIPSSASSATASYDVVMIAADACMNCKKISSVIIPNTVTSIGRNAFLGCTALTSVVIPGSVESIDDLAFWDCPNLISIQYSADTPIWVPSHVFDHEADLRATLYLRPSAIELASDIMPWMQFKYIEPIDESGAPRDFAYTFEGQTVYYHVTDEEAETCTPVLWQNCSEASDGVNLVLPENPKNGDKKYTLTEIRSCAFFQCSDLTSVSIPNTVTSIGTGAFASSDISSIIIPNSVTTIDDQAFAFCKNLISVDVPNSVTSIGAGAFLECSSLTSVSLSNSVESIGMGAFDCSSLTSIKYSAEHPIEAESDIFYFQVYSNATLYVPQAAFPRVNTVTPWKLFEKIEVLEPESGIEDIYVDGDDVPAEIYTLTGIRVESTAATLSPGIYIERRGNTTRKIRVR